MSLDITLTAVRPTTVYERNITHNLTEMADKAGLYTCMWCPEELDIKTAGDMIGFLENGIKELLSNPEYYKTFNPANGWGSYEGFVVAVGEYLQACKDNPDAEISIWR